MKFKKDRCVQVYRQDTVCVSVGGACPPPAQVSLSASFYSSCSARVSPSTHSCSPVATCVNKKDKNARADPRKSSVASLVGHPREQLLPERYVNQTHFVSNQIAEAYCKATCYKADMCICVGSGGRGGVHSEEETEWKQD